MRYRIPHPHDWNRCSLSQRKTELPHKPGVYAVMNWQGKILYIGRAKNLNKRWASGHHRYPQAEELWGAQLAFLQLHANQVNDVEAQLIREYSPDWNNTAVPKDEGGFDWLLALAAAAILAVFAFGEKPATFQTLPQTSIEHFDD